MRTLGGRYQLMQRIRSAAPLAHPNVANVHDFGTSPSPGRDVPYIVMELVEGQTLGEHMGAGPLDWRIGVRICAEVAAALSPRARCVAST